MVDLGRKSVEFEPLRSPLNVPPDLGRAPRVRGRLAAPRGVRLGAQALEAVPAVGLRDPLPES